MVKFPPRQHAVTGLAHVPSGTPVQPGARRPQLPDPAAVYWSGRSAVTLRGPCSRDLGIDGHSDARVTFANERTFLAWSRTALALVVAGLAIVQLLPPFPGVPWGRRALGIPLIVLGAVISVASYGEWVRSQEALRRGDRLPRSVLPRILAVTITGIAVIAAVVLLVSALR